MSWKFPWNAQSRKETVRETVLYFKTWGQGCCDVRVWVKAGADPAHKKRLYEFIRVRQELDARTLVDQIAGHFPDYVNAAEARVDNIAELTYNEWP